MRTSRGRLLLVLGCLVAVAALVGAGVLLRPDARSSAASTPTASAPSATSSPAPSSAGGRGTYLALGDSVPFGFHTGDAPRFDQPASFTGYPELLGRDLGLRVLNASCPGETSASFSDTTARAYGCENSPQSPRLGYRAAYPLHVEYRLPESQLDYAVRTLRARKDVELVTLQLGANDAFLCRATTADRCTGEAASVVAGAQRNVDAVLAALRDRAGYRGRIVVVTYYSLDYTGSLDTGTQALDAALATAAHAHDAVVADGYAAFRPGAEQAGGSSVGAGLVRPGDVHPTDRGQRLLADAVRQALGS